MGSVKGIGPWARLDKPAMAPGGNHGEQGTTKDTKWLCYQQSYLCSSSYSMEQKEAA